MRDDAEAAEAPHVFDDVTRFAAKWIRRLRHADRDVMAALGAQLDPVNDENARAVLRGSGLRVPSP